MLAFFYFKPEGPRLNPLSGARELGTPRRWPPTSPSKTGLNPLSGARELGTLGLRRRPKQLFQSESPQRGKGVGDSPLLHLPHSTDLVSESPQRGKGVGDRPKESWFLACNGSESPQRGKGVGDAHAGDVHRGLGWSESPQRGKGVGDKVGEAVRTWHEAESESPQRGKGVGDTAACIVPAKPVGV